MGPWWGGGAEGAAAVEAELAYPKSAGAVGRRGTWGAAGAGAGGELMAPWSVEKAAARLASSGSAGAEGCTGTTGPPAGGLEKGGSEGAGVGAGAALGV